MDTNMYEELRQVLTDGDGYLDLEVVSLVGIMQRVRKRAIRDAIEALRPPDIRPSLEVRKESEYVDGRCSEMTYLDNRIAALKEREGLE